MLVCKRLLGEAVEVILISLVGPCVVKHELSVHVTDPLRLEGKRVVGHGRLTARLPLLRRELPGPIELVTVLGERRLDDPLPISGVHDRYLLRDMLSCLCVEVQSAVGIGRSASALDLIDADIHVRSEGHCARVDARLLRSEFQAQLGHRARSGRCISCCFPGSSFLLGISRRPPVSSRWGHRAAPGRVLGVDLLPLAGTNLGLVHNCHLLWGCVEHGRQLHIVDDRVR
mmetsp:Transcript_57171/g.122971  ORF Transcript_57171/g.122971 Transcript_57171/m.122971 type:complete len:229 (+) Transcript_57171:2061-2747(+)